MAIGHGGAAAGRLRAELGELIGKPVQLNILQVSWPAQSARAPGG